MGVWTGVGSALCFDFYFLRESFLGFMANGPTIPGCSAVCFESDF